MEKFSIKTFRVERLKISQTELAEQLGMSRQTISRHECGKQSPPRHLLFALLWIEKHPPKKTQRGEK